MSPDGRYFVAAGTGPENIRIGNLDDGSLQPMRGHDRQPTCVAFTRDGKFVVTGSADHTVKLWSFTAGTMAPVRTYSGPLSDVNCVAVSPDGRLILSGDMNGNIFLWNFRGDIITTFTSRRVPQKEAGWMYAVTGVAFSPDGKTAASGTRDGMVCLWRPDGRPIKATMEHSREVCVAFNPRNGTLLSGAWDGTLVFWSADGRRLKTLKSAAGPVKCVAFSPDGRYLLSGTHDNVLTLRDADSGEVLANMVADGSGREIVYTPDGYWDGSRDGGGLVAMIRGLSAFGVDQFAVRNNRPDIVLERIGTGDTALREHYRAQYLKRVMKMEKLYGLRGFDLSWEPHVPAATIVSLDQKGKFVTLCGALGDDRYGLRAYNIFVNDVPLYGAFGKRVPGMTAKIEERIELSAGVNKIELSCLNEKGAESYRALTYADYGEMVRGDLYFIGFGVSEYRDQSLNLGYAHKDVIDLAAGFRRMEGTRFKKVHINVYVNGQVTRDAVARAKKHLTKASVDDTFVLFIAGHGMHDREAGASYYYLTHDADVGKLSQTAVRFEMIEDLLMDIAPRNKLFLMDTCESGEMEDDALQRFESATVKGRGVRARTIRIPQGRGIALKPHKRPHLLERNRFIYNDLFRRSGAIVFSSCRGNEVSYEMKELGNGFFTHAIIRALEGGKADRNADGLVSTAELRDFVSAEVPALCKRLQFSEDQVQHPTVDRDNIYVNFSFPAGNDNKEKRHTLPPAR